MLLLLWHIDIANRQTHFEGCVAVERDEVIAHVLVEALREID